ncbi:MAG TPA: NFACT RNA binding domain-containing protein [Chloroflexota bacterium]|nr:NFACT RNA binding domain-containing protein [Chloroflexota bacterium]
MPFDSVTTRAVADDLCLHLLGGRVDKIMQPEAMAIALLFWAEHGNQWLVLSAHAQQARVQRTTRKQASAFSEPTSWVMLLRKYLEGSRLVAVEQQGVDRVLRLTFQGGPTRSVLIAELMGRYSNLILADPTMVVLGALKHIRADQNRFRVTLPHHPYLTPPMPMQPPPHDDRPKRDPLRALGGDLAADLAVFEDGALLWKALLDLVDGLSPTLAREVVYVTTGAVDTAVGGRRDLATATALLAAVRERYGPDRGAPSAVWEGERLREYAPYPLHQFGSEPTRYDDLAALLDVVYEPARTPDPIAHPRAALLALIEPHQAVLRRKITSLQSTIVGPERLAELRAQGEMVLAYQHGIEPEQRELAVPEMGLTIPLDPALTPLENAQRFFKRYQKARDAAAITPGLLETARQDLDYLDQLAVHAALATDPQSLAAVRGEAREVLVGPAPAGKVRKKGGAQPGRGVKGKGAGGKAEPRAVPLRLRAADGTEILIGRSARQNEELTFRLAGPRDIWLHARQIPGAHVILRVAGQTPSPAALHDAAALAAYHSQARESTAVPVDYAPVRNVRRIKGGKPGMVHYSGESTLNVRPRPPA